MRTIINSSLHAQTSTDQPSSDRIGIRECQSVPFFDQQFQSFVDETFEELTFYTRIQTSETLFPVSSAEDVER